MDGAAVRLFVEPGLEVHPERSPVYRLFDHSRPSVDGYRGPRFVVKENAGVSRPH